MNSSPGQALFQYYDERAGEYDQLYSGQGGGVPVPEAYVRDAGEIAAICRQYGRGHLVDIGCGTGYWLENYHANCAEITLVDQSRRMLVECQARVARLGLALRVNYVKGDFFMLRFLTGSFDSAVVAFFVSHLVDEEVSAFFRKVRGSLRSGATLLLIDGSWSPARAQHREKEGMQTRRLGGGLEFSIYKRYFTPDDVERILCANGFDVGAIYAGEVFLACRASLRT